MTIQNLGDTDLILDPVQTADASNAQLQSAVYGATTLAGRASTSLTLVYLPTRSGPFSLTLVTPNNDADENQFRLTVGIGLAARQAQILVASAEAINDQVARHLQSHVSNRMSAIALRRGAAVRGGYSKTT